MLVGLPVKPFLLGQSFSPSNVHEPGLDREGDSAAQCDWSFPPLVLLIDWVSYELDFLAALLNLRSAS